MELRNSSNEFVRNKMARKFFSDTRKDFFMHNAERTGN